MVIEKLVMFAKYTQWLEATMPTRIYWACSSPLVHWGFVYTYVPPKLTFVLHKMVKGV